MIILKKIVIVVCVLYNICIERGDLYDVDNSDLDDSFDDDGEGRNEIGNNIWDILKDYVWENL